MHEEKVERLGWEDKFVDAPRHYIPANKKDQNHQSNNDDDDDEDDHDNNNNDDDDDRYWLVERTVAVAVAVGS